MSNERPFIRHEILNIITVINFLVAAADVSEKEKKEILSRLKMVALLTAETEFFLGNKKKFSHQKVELDEIFEMIDCLLEEETKKRRVCLSLMETDLVVLGDRDAILHALEQIIRRLMDSSKKIRVVVDKKKKKLSITYDSDLQLCVREENMMEILKHHSDDAELFFQVALRSLDLSGVKTIFKKGLVELTFTQ